MPKALLQPLECQPLQRHRYPRLLSQHRQRLVSGQASGLQPVSRHHESLREPSVRPSLFTLLRISLLLSSLDTPVVIQHVSRLFYGHLRPSPSKRYHRDYPVWDNHPQYRQRLCSIIPAGLRRPHGQRHTIPLHNPSRVASPPTLSVRPLGFPGAQTSAATTFLGNINGKDEVGYYTDDNITYDQFRVYLQVQLLFKDAPDQLSEFRDFLPKAAPSIPSQNGVVILPQPGGRFLVGTSGTRIQALPRHKSPLP